MNYVMNHDFRSKSMTSRQLQKIQNKTNSEQNCHLLNSIFELHFCLALFNSNIEFKRWQFCSGICFILYFMTSDPCINVRSYGFRAKLYNYITLKAICSFRKLVCCSNTTQSSIVFVLLLDFIIVHILLLMDIVFTFAS